MKRGRIYTIHFGDNTDITRQFVTEIASFLNEALELVLINNSKNIDLDYLACQYITVINAPENLGYFGGFKYGTKKTTLNNLDYLIICNNDIKICNSDFFRILNDKLNNYDIIAPSIKTPDGIEQNPHRENSTSIFRKYFYQIYYCSYLLAFVINNSIILKKYLMKNAQPIQRERKIFSPHGAFIIFNSSYFKKGGYIDDGYFLYGEEDSVAAISNKLNLTIGFIPELKIFHKESVTTGRWLTYKKFKIQKSAYKYIKNKYEYPFLHLN